MKAKLRYYVGLRAGARYVLASDLPVTEESHGHVYSAVIGPFRTKRGARFMATNGQGNPHVQTVADAERIAKMLASR